MQSNIGYLGQVILLLFSIGFFLYGILFYFKNKKYKYTAIGYTTVGIFFLIISISFFLPYTDLFCFIFAGGFVSLLIFALLIGKKIRNEKAAMMVEKCRGIDKKDPIKASDLFSSKMHYKLLLKKGPSYTAKINTFIVAFTYATTFSVMNYYMSNGEVTLLILNFTVLFLIFTPLFYFSSKKEFERSLDNYLNKKTDKKSHK